MAATGSAIHDKRNPFPATIIDNLPIVGRGSTKETRHVEISLAGSGLHYEPGDELGIAATNGPGVVSALLAALQLAPEEISRASCRERVCKEVEQPGVAG